MVVGHGVDLFVRFRHVLGLGDFCLSRTLFGSRNHCPFVAASNIGGGTTHTVERVLPSSHSTDSDVLLANILALSGN